MDPHNGQYVGGGPTQSLQPSVRPGGGSVMASASCQSLVLEIFNKLMNYELRKGPPQSDLLSVNVDFQQDNDAKLWQCSKVKWI